VASIMAALKTYDALGMIGQPINDLPLTLITPLGANHDDIFSHFQPF
jgi:hypothetical protein